jgi:hypothetical protein
MSTSETNTTELNAQPVPEVTVTNVDESDAAVVDPAADSSAHDSDDEDNGAGVGDDLARSIRELSREFRQLSTPFVGDSRNANIPRSVAETERLLDHSVPSVYCIAIVSRKAVEDIPEQLDHCRNLRVNGLHCSTHSPLKPFCAVPSCNRKISANAGDCCWFHTLNVDMRCMKCSKVVREENIALCPTCSVLPAEIKSVFILEEQFRIAHGHAMEKMYRTTMIEAQRYIAIATDIKASHDRLLLLLTDEQRQSIAARRPDARREIYRERREMINECRRKFNGQIRAVRTTLLTRDENGVLRFTDYANSIVAARAYWSTRSMRPLPVRSLVPDVFPSQWSSYAEFLEHAASLARERERERFDRP